MTFAAAAVTILTLNLHGYHPMGEAPRVEEDRRGSRRPARSDLYYFSEAEILAGHARRNRSLARDIGELAPDFVVLQEVAAGSPRAARKSCADFHANQNPDDPWRNTALKLADEIDGETYKVALACRGNVGWQTNPDRFAAKRVLRKMGQAREIVFDFGANPYPHGMLVEGFAMLVKKSWTIEANDLWRLSYNGRGDSVALQVALLRRGDRDDDLTRLLVANVHGGHKLAHFEQAVAIRAALHDHAQNLRRSGRLSGVVIAGDFNAELFRPSRGHDTIDVASVPWEAFADGEFDVRNETPSEYFGPSDLEAALWRLNWLDSYKPFATVRDRREAGERIHAAIERWQTFAARAGADAAMSEAVAEAEDLGRCRPLPFGRSACERWRRIDHIFFSQGLGVAQAAVIYDEADFEELVAPSDHPGIVAHLSLVPGNLADGRQQ